MENTNNKQNHITKKEPFTEPQVEIIEFEVVSTDIYTSGFSGDTDEEGL